MQKGKTIIIACGASGGHIFPAVSVADELKKEGYNCVFVGNGKSFSSTIEKYGYRSIPLPVSPWNVKNPVRKAMALINFVRAFFKAVKILHDEKASTVFGTGGYATVAAVLAGKFSGIPTVVHEQNVLPGRANKLLSKWVDKICLSFDESRHYLKYRKGAIAVCGNPVRQALIDAVGEKRKEDGMFRLLVLGGSQGAKILSDVVPLAVKNLHDDKKSKIEVIQQTRPEDEERVRKAYADLGVKAEVASFFDDIPQRLIQSHLVVGRSGASTVTECMLLGRAAVFVPLRLADGHQLQNAQVMEQGGAAVVIEQPQFTGERLSQELIHFMKDKVHLKAMEKASAKLAHHDAAKKVAQEVVAQAQHDVIHLSQPVQEEK